MAVKSITVGPGVLNIGTDTLLNFSSQVTTVRLIPSVDLGDPIRTLSGESLMGDRSETWTVEGEILQDLGATESTTEWLFEHAGEEHPFEYTPSSLTGKEITGTLVVEAVEIGGESGTKPTSEFAFSVIGRPVISTITAGA
ncbi:hypothetical protein F7P69_00785 [Cellulosimicrobium funkei]|nr:hypothetical protein [Cellulosimicrobium funkei]